ncbi:MAG: SDR family NAD(P)-dependent oxidoreductase [Pseudomonadota bacterium]
MPTGGKTYNVIWITGASSGIGEAVARRFAADGETVAISARSEGSLARIAADYPSVHAYPCDIGDREACETTLAAIERDLGEIDLALLCAGTWDVVDVEDIAIEPIEKAMRINYLGTVHCLVPLVQLMMKRGRGQIAPVSSVAGYRGLPRATAYGPTKAALNSLCESLKPSLDKYGVTTTVVNPGFVATPMTEKNDFPMPFLLQPEEAAEHIVKGLRAKRYEVAFPWQLVLQLKLLSVLPARLFFFLMRKAVVKA